MELESGDEWQIARGRNNYGITLLYAGSHESARGVFEAAISGFRSAADPHMESIALNNLSDAHIEAGRKNLAREALNRSREIDPTARNLLEQAINKINMAHTMDLPEELDSALELYREGRYQLRRLGDKRNQAIVVIYMASALQSAGRDGDAAALYGSALDLARSVGAAHEEAQALRGLGTAELQLGSLGSAEQHLEAALGIAREISAHEEERRTAAALAELRLRMEGRDSGEGL
jgi:tetratricopeptide (TPR) repeat protein